MTDALVCRQLLIWNLRNALLAALLMLNMQHGLETHFLNQNWFPSFSLAPSRQDTSLPKAGTGPQGVLLTELTVKFEHDCHRHHFSKFPDFSLT